MPTPFHYLQITKSYPLRKSSNKPNCFLCTQFSMATPPFPLNMFGPKIVIGNFFRIFEMKMNSACLIRESNYSKKCLFTLCHWNGIMLRNLSSMRIKLPLSTPCVKNYFLKSWNSNKSSNVGLLGLPGSSVFINFSYGVL